MDFIEGTPFPDMFVKDDACLSDGRKEKCLLQGDIIKISDKESRLFKKQMGAVGYLVVSNSCDLVNRNVRSILLVPIYSFDVWFNDHTKKQLDGRAKALYNEANYEKKATFLISPLAQFGNKPTMAFIDDIKSIRFSFNVFNWDDVPGIDSAKLTNFLTRVFGIDWVNDTNLEKIEDGNIIQASTETNTLFLVYNHSEAEAILIVDDGRINKFEARRVNGKLNVIFNLYTFLLKHRLCSLKPPWREQLGHKVGNLFNRVSTYSPEHPKIRDWVEENTEDPTKGKSKVIVETKSAKATLSQ